MIKLERIIWKYGYNEVKMNKYVGDMIEKFEKIYKIKENGKYL
jgi:hypothetical protein